MVIPGYDPEDLEDRLEELLSERDRNAYLTAEEQAEYDSGASLVDLLSTDDIRDLLAKEQADGD
ncbi:hypothetical protein C440_02938 [Haloferax mucosum ATCC BAA-1512]|uniref:DUF8027 domain-containing protein n=1 Tax=Haloferax mucosum ATCC BAA-1512 TaxID=662479 RepID=M0IRR7_9EURY|nr:hypothetical protein [Haloferax mucosum]ELZ98169.1 hypothetical protein C440_02938 [Haloferax mucosum ATCC BAA-1512]